ncbi:hypothetical protein MNV49_007262 [Pseudohyphozyma bogoriensis]|nr:hypothetical protein MNV49_007262 [Pseudohyphozyma bogoriensis]
MANDDDDDRPQFKQATVKEVLALSFDSSNTRLSPAATQLSAEYLRLFTLEALHRSTDAVKAEQAAEKGKSVGPKLVETAVIIPSILVALIALLENAHARHSQDQADVPSQKLKWNEYNPNETAWLEERLAEYRRLSTVAVENLPHDDELLAAMEVDEIPDIARPYLLQVSTKDITRALGAALTKDLALEFLYRVQQDPAFRKDRIPPWDKSKIDFQARIADEEYDGVDWENDDLSKKSYEHPEVAPASSSHLFTFVNKCGYSVKPTFANTECIYTGCTATQKAAAKKHDYTGAQPATLASGHNSTAKVNYGWSAGRVFNQDGSCGTLGEGCTMAEFTLDADNIYTPNGYDISNIQVGPLNAYPPGSHGQQHLLQDSIKTTPSAATLWTVLRTNAIVLRAHPTTDPNDQVVIKRYLHLQLAHALQSATSEFYVLRDLNHYERESEHKRRGILYLVEIWSNHPPTLEYPFIVLEPLSFSLTSLLRFSEDQNQLLSRILVDDLFGQVVRAVAWIHGYFYVTDLKPDNVMLTYNSSTQSAMVKLVDCDSFQQRGRPFRAQGTVFYQPPEAPTGGALDGAQWDAWSLGVVLLEMMLQDNILEIHPNGPPTGPRTTLDANDLAVRRLVETHFPKPKGKTRRLLLLPQYLFIPPRYIQSTVMKFVVETSLCLAFLVGYVAAASPHTFTFINQCAYSVTPTLANVDCVYTSCDSEEQAEASSHAFTGAQSPTLSQGQTSSVSVNAGWIGRAYDQNGSCGSLGENCSMTEFNLDTGSFWTPSAYDLSNIQGFTQSLSIAADGGDTVTCTTVDCACNQAYPPGNEQGCGVYIDSPMSNESLSNKAGNATNGTIGEQTLLNQASTLASHSLDYAKGVAGIGAAKGAESAEDAKTNPQGESGSQTLGDLVNEGRNLAGSVLSSVQSVVGTGADKTKEAAGDAQASADSGKPQGYVAQARDLAAGAIGTVESYVSAGAAKVNEAASTTSTDDIKANASGTIDEAIKKGGDVIDATEDKAEALKNQTWSTTSEDVKQAASEFAKDASNKMDEGAALQLRKTGMVVGRQPNIRRTCLKSAVVLRARMDADPHQSIAVKYFKRTEDPRKLNTAINEFDRLRHLLALPGGPDHLVQLYSDSPPSRDYPYIFLQPLDFALHTLISYTDNRDMILAPDLIGVIFAQLVQAVDWFHRNNVFLMDLKPDNIMFTREGGTLRLKLVDFGLLAYHGAQRQQLGTISYWPPEVLDQRNARNHIGGDAWDIWSLGVILQE